MNWDTCVKDYLQIVKNGCPKELRPTRCRHCQSKAKFHRHGSYFRSLYTMGGDFEIRIFRFKCSACAKTCSVLPSFLRRNHTAALDLQEYVVRSHSKGLPLWSISKQLATTQFFSEKTLWRWKNYWQKILDKLEQNFWPIVITRHPHLLLPRGSCTPNNLLGWIFWVWDQIRQHVTDKSAGCFQWLTFLSQPMTVTVGT